MVDFCNLSDLGYVGPNYIQCYNREGDAGMGEGLYKFLANQLWSQNFLNTSINHGIAAYSDNFLIWLYFDWPPRLNQKSKRFCFEAMWASEPECQSIV